MQNFMRNPFLALSNHQINLVKTYEFSTKMDWSKTTFLLTAYVYIYELGWSRMEIKILLLLWPEPDLFLIFIWSLIRLLLPSSRHVSFPSMIWIVEVLHPKNLLCPNFGHTYKVVSWVGARAGRGYVFKMKYRLSTFFPNFCPTLPYTTLPTKCSHHILMIR